MKILMAKLVETTSKQRFYELNYPLLKGRRLCEDVDIPQELEESKEKYTKPEFKDFVRTDGAHIVCVSDAGTHTERLVFTAEKFPFGYSRLNVQIDGKHTIMIHGGDANSVYPDEVYLRHLAMINGFSSIQILKGE
jgi:hypothetical protein